MNGDSSKTSQALAAPINAAKTSTAEDIKARTMFSPRSGGTAASNAAASDKIHGYIADLIGNLTGSSASDLASTGSSALSQGVAAYDEQAKLSQQQMENWHHSLLGLGITKAAGFGLGAVLGA